ncbi:aldehyde dehydrogenase [Hygrophoropsis aurantiaca]|uniref:Aldehyde dehydrogenase n=1 Tax=Hygrophoropsis aurantiaca TaxID=72124 RepID=A0ACB8A5S6_9AGAM|nr:aldehyde dehydrogenase [Hygrophoropsis aurantiaca]
MKSPRYCLIPTSSSWTSPSDALQIRETLRATFKKGTTRPIEWRQRQLKQLVKMCQEKYEDFYEALQIDLGKPRVEVLLGEVGAVIARATKSEQQVAEWAKPEHPEVHGEHAKWNPTVHKAPRGTVLIISPWNYPIILTLQPLIGAIAAGCCAVVKPSEHVPTFAQKLALFLPDYLDRSAYQVVNGEAGVAQKLLGLQWDHIFYTGGGRVARIIARAAAEHLTPMTLELGGKSPVVIDDKYDVELAAKRILWGKCNNAGQICVAPDYILCPRNIQAKLVSAFSEHYRKFFPEGALKSDDFGKIVNDAHVERLTSLIKDTKGTIVLGGNHDGRKLEPTIVQDVEEGDPLLEDEIFGPILPIVPVDSLDDAIRFIQARPHPLVLYAFTDNDDFKGRLINETQSGGIAFNDTFQQLAVNELPFGGVGESGYGYQIMKYTFDTFTQLRSAVDVPKGSETDMERRYPPHNKEAIKAMAPIVLQTSEHPAANGRF